jgi:DNA-binding phage protein
MNLNQIFPDLVSRSINISQVARRAGISRATYYKVRQNPNNTTVHRLKSIAKALGYRMIITFEKIDDHIDTE